MSALSKDSLSRLGVSLKARDGQKYDQVIALAQGNINQSLKHYFDNHEEALEFDVLIRGLAKMQLKGQLKTPTIELIDKDGADKALYTLTFAKGSKYTTWVPKDPEDEDAGRIPFAQDATGWKICFEVSFALEDMTSVPEDIKKQINKPGEYSVAQLIVIFNTAETLNFNWEKSVITLKDHVAIADARAGFKQFIDRWLTGTAMNTDPAKRNVLGYAVTTKNPRVVEPAAPSFPPTSVRLQTIAHRPGGDASKVDTDCDYNAFLFTEMCQNKPMIASDLPWSGDLFYESIGGTLLMSRAIFWDDYIKTALNPINRVSKNAANSICRDITGGRVGEWVISGDSSDLEKHSFSIEARQLEYGYSKTANHQYNSQGMTIRPSFVTDIANTVWQHNNNCFTFKRYLDLRINLDAALEAETLGIRARLGSAALEMHITCTSKSIFKMSSVETTGRLNIDVENKANDLEVVVTPRYDPMMIDLLRAIGLGGLVDLLTGLLGEEDMKKKVAAALKEATDKAVDVKEELGAAFSRQSKFVFPGAGSFDMKDPLFTNDGDLIMGLVYRH